MNVQCDPCTEMKNLSKLRITLKKEDHFMLHSFLCNVCSHIILIRVLLDVLLSPSLCLIICVVRCSQLCGLKRVQGGKERKQDG